MGSTETKVGGEKQKTVCQQIADSYRESQRGTLDWPTQLSTYLLTLIDSLSEMKCYLPILIIFYFAVQQNNLHFKTVLRF